jgi:hypothetical protein
VDRVIDVCRRCRFDFPTALRAFISSRDRDRDIKANQFCELISIWEL